MPTITRWILTTWLLGCLTAPVAADLPVMPGMVFSARDTLAPGPEPSADALACLNGLLWPAADFQVRCETARDRGGDIMIRFPSPIPSGDAANDEVAMEWYVARDEDKRPARAPAVVVVHESGSGMTVGRTFARGLRMRGLHAFLIQLPYYGERRAGGGRPGGDNLVTVIRQAVADVRRARDAVAVLPLVDNEKIALQGTSLGGFVCATSASLDCCYDRVFLMLAGGDLYDVLHQGHREAAKFREELARAGLAGEPLRELLATIEPTRLAHRLDPARTWLYSAQFDQVVPLKNANLLAKSASLDDSHHIQMFGDHYTGIIYLPVLLAHIHGQIDPSAIQPAADAE